MSHKVKLLYAILIVLIVVTLWPSQEGQKPDKIRIWNAHVESGGQLNVLGVVLGKSTLKEAETALHTQSERALFVTMKDDKVESETIEAFFPTSPDRAKIVIELNADQELVQQIRKQAYKSVIFPSGTAKIEISPERMPQVETLTTKSLTYIPPISLDATTIQQQFGKSDQQQGDADGNMHLLYPALGLDVVLPREGKTMFQFVPPQEFDRLLELISSKPEAGTE